MLNNSMVREYHIEICADVDYLSVTSSSPSKTMVFFREYQHDGDWKELLLKAVHDFFQRVGEADCTVGFRGLYNGFLAERLGVMEGIVLPLELIVERAHLL